MSTHTTPSASHRGDPPLTTSDLRSTADPTVMSPRAARLGATALTLLRLALGIEFLWAFFDKLLGLGYSTPSARAWIHGGSPTKGFLSGVASGPLRSTFNAMAGSTVLDWLFMVGLLGIGTALLLGIALRLAAASGVVLLAMMWFATWPLATMAAGVPTHSTNPIVDDHVISALALVVVAAYAAHASGSLGRWWAHQDLVQRSSWLR